VPQINTYAVKDSPSPASNVTTPASSGQHKTNNTPTSKPSPFARKRCVLPKIDKLSLFQPMKQELSMIGMFARKT